MTKEQGTDERRPQGRMTASMLAAMAAGVVSISALGVSIYEAYLMREQQQAAVMPILEAWSYISESDGFGVNVANKGIGPARVMSVTVRLDGEPVRSWRVLYGELLGRDVPSFAMSMITGNVMAPGEIVTALSFEASADAVELWRGSDRVSLAICYCSVFEQCWLYLLEDLQAGVPETEEVRGCEAVEETHF